MASQSTSVSTSLRLTADTREDLPPLQRLRPQSQSKENQQDDSLFQEKIVKELVVFDRLFRLVARK
jgi:hypothetical protein